MAHNVEISGQNAGRVFVPLDWIVKICAEFIIGGFMENINYAIETLEIELNKIKATLRIIEANIHEQRSPIPAYDLYEKRKQEIEKAIEIIKKYLGTINENI